MLASAMVTVKLSRAEVVYLVTMSLVLNVVKGLKGQNDRRVLLNALVIDSSHLECYYIISDWLTIYGKGR